MLKYIFLFQAIIYLVIMPSVHDKMAVAYNPPLFPGILACLSLLAGIWVRSTLLKADIKLQGSNTPVIEIQRYAIIGFILLTISYAYISWQNGLMNRRQGSEIMAIIYGNLPIYELIILRVYEIVFIPYLILYLFFSRYLYERMIVLVLSLSVLPFMGLDDSRGRLIILAINLLSFIRVETFLRFLYTNIRIYLLLLGIIGVFYYVTVKRLNQYSGISDFIYAEIVIRLDGLNLVSELKDFGFINYRGSFDWNMFSPLISRIPFLESAQAAKIAGLTSTKQYYLQALLGTNRFDQSNSMITDPLYWGGLGAVVFCFSILGYAIAQFDIYIRGGRFGTNRYPLAVAMAFVMSYSIIEVDLFGAFTSLLQNLAICVALLIASTKLLKRGGQRRRPMKYLLTLTDEPNKL